MNASVADACRTHQPRRSGQFPPTDADKRANEMVIALAAMAPDDPRRAALRRRTIEAWLPMAQRLGRRYAGRGENLDDLQQVAMVGLIKSVDRFDAERGDDFVGFAVPTILGELRRHFRDRTWSMRVPRKVQEMRLAINEANATLFHKLNRLPTVADISQHLGVSEEDVLEGLEGGRAYRATSLSTPVAADATVVLADTLAEEEHGYDLVEIQLALGPALARLTARERQILAMRFWGNQTQSVIAEKVGVSQMHISRILSTTLAKLRTELTVD
ncbi:SigB/SigF/SigG family RNA polymerase sigma factor [Actinoplanes friuliensis]|jgi:RNA polymerase sigma-B factor|uniref:RNA polymerase sigma factor rpoD n=1 Tax=Actinoplanes friuliensis DSM 7358 TaxID=1246995 RepID=U5W0X6_9ACTN|nr:RNA polymerase sigma factor rpoD [Actinoplanes friuliensis DSM 7358]